MAATFGVQLDTSMMSTGPTDESIAVQLKDLGLVTSRSSSTGQSLWAYEHEDEDDHPERSSYLCLVIRYSRHIDRLTDYITSSRMHNLDAIPHMDVI
jgi:hypothetical protein